MPWQRRSESPLLDDRRLAAGDAVDRRRVLSSISTIDLFALGTLNPRATSARVFSRREGDRHSAATVNGN